MGYLKRKQRGGKTRAERYDARTEKRVIRKHERERRKYYRKSGETDPLKFERTRADRRGKGIAGQRVVESGTPMFAMPGEEKYGVRYGTGTYSNPRFMGQGSSRTEALSDKVERYKKRRDRFRPEDTDPKPRKNKVRKPRNKKTRRPSGRSGNYIRDIGRAIKTGCKRVWDRAKHAFTLPPGCRGNKSAYNRLGGYI